MPATFHIDVDTRRDLVNITLSGFFTPDDLVRFRERRRAVQPQLTCGPNEHNTIIDISNLKVQTQATVAEFAALLAHPTIRPKRLALVAVPTLARSQVQRAMNGRQAEWFDTRAEAETWMFGDAVRRAA